MMIFLLWMFLAFAESALDGQKIVAFSRDFIPEHYDLRLELLNYRINVTQFKGIVKMRLNCIADTSVITLHRRELTIDSIKVMSFDPKSPTPVQIRQADVSNSDFIVINALQSMKKGLKYVVTVNFYLYLSPTGLHKTSFYGDGLRPLVITRLYPNNARSLFPCVDEPDMKATFNLTLIYEEQLNAVSNLELVEQSVTMIHAMEYSVSNYSSKSPIAPYQLAFTVNDFDELEEYDGSCPTVFGYTDTRFTEIDTAINYTTSILSYYQDLLGIDFPVPNMTLITAPGISLEYSGGLGLLGVPYVVEEDSWQDHEHMVTLLSRALLRQLLSYVITLQSWSDLWIIEGLSWYLGQETIQFLFPSQNISTMYEGCWSLYGEGVLNQAVPLVAEFNDTSLPSIEEFGQKSYCMFHMMAYLVGEKNFLTGVKYFVKRSDNKTVDRKSFVSSFNSSDLPAAVSIQEVLNSWLLTSGMSVLNVTDSSVSLGLQSTAFPVGSQNKSCRWIRVESGAFKSRWIGCEPTYSIATTPTKMNMVVQDGLLYYRVLYNSSTYAWIAENLQGTKVNKSLTKPQLLDDVLAFAWSGYTNYSVALNLVSYLSRETEYLPWKITLDHFERLWFILRGVHREEDFKKYMRSLIMPAYKKLKVFFDDPKLTEDGKKLRALIGMWACRLAVSECTVSANLLLVDLDQVPKHLTEIVLREFAANKSGWLEVQDVYKRTSSYDQLLQIIRALGSSPHMLSYVLELMERGIPSMIVSHHRRLILETIIAETEHPIWLYNSLLADFQLIDYPLRKHVMRKAAQRMVTSDDEELLRMLIKRYGENPVDTTPLQDALLIVQGNLAWLKNRCNEFLSALGKYSVEAE